MRLLLHPIVPLIITGLMSYAGVQHIVYTMFWKRLRPEQHYDRLLLAGSLLLGILLYGVVYLQSRGLIDVSTDGMIIASRIAWLASLTFHILYSGRVWRLLKWRSGSD